MGSGPQTRHAPPYRLSCVVAAQRATLLVLVRSKSDARLDAEYAITATWTPRHAMALLPPCRAQVSQHDARGLVMDLALPLFRGLQGGRLQPTILAAIIRRSATRAELSKPVTAHTLRHTSATWLRRATGDARLVTE
jgi:integrase/recombinase XerC